MKDKIINECKKYGYDLEYQIEDYFYSFRNTNVREELQVFQVRIDEDWNSVSMVILIDLASWSYDSIDSNLNDENEIMENIKLWISPDNLKEVEKYFLSEQ